MADARMAVVSAPLLAALLLAVVLGGCAGRGCWDACRQHGQSRAYCAAWCVPAR